MSERDTGSRRRGRVPRVLLGAVGVGVALHPSGVRAQDAGRFALRVEAGLGTMLSEYQRNDDPARFHGNVKGFEFALQATARLAYTVAAPLAFQLSVANWIFPSHTGETGWVFAPMVGARVEPTVGCVGRFFVDVNLGVALTGDDRRFTFDAGTGFEFALARSVGLGPALRYAHVLQPDSHGDDQRESYPFDARYWSLGLALAWRPGTREETPPADTDHDGLFDRDDLCPAVPRGAHPDPQRLGCPLVDSDGDGTWDREDICPMLARGDHHDPERPGCPAIDTDGDGVSDTHDRCVAIPEGPQRDPDRPGCPDPDADADGVVDHEDQCRGVPAGARPDAARPGCPLPAAPPPAAANAPYEIIYNRRLVVLRRQIEFGTGRWDIIGARNLQIVESVALLLRSYPDFFAHVEIQGHTDDRGPDEANQALSERRAQAVRNALVTLGVPADRLTAAGYGESAPEVPIQPPMTRLDLETAWARNRRVVFHYTSAATSAGATPTAPPEPTAPP